MPQPDSVLESVVILMGAGAFIFAFLKFLNGIRRMVHFFDRVLSLSDKIEDAVDLITTEFSPNGGASFKDKHNQMSASIAAIDKRTEVITGMMVEEEAERHHAT